MFIQGNSKFKNLFYLLIVLVFIGLTFNVSIFAMIILLNQ